MAYSLWRDFLTVGKRSSDRNYYGMKELSSEAVTSHMLERQTVSKLSHLRIPLG